MSGDFVSKLLD